MENNKIDIRMDRHGIVLEGRPIIRMAQLPAANDEYLWVVMAEYEEQYVTWLYNASGMGFSSGNYFEQTEEGYQQATWDFKERVARYDEKYLAYSAPRDARIEAYQRRMADRD